MTYYDGGGPGGQVLVTNPDFVSPDGNDSPCLVCSTRDQGRCGSAPRVCVEWLLLGRASGGWKVVRAGRKKETGWKAAGIARGSQGCQTGNETASADFECGFCVLFVDISKKLI